MKSDGHERHFFLPLVLCPQFLAFTFSTLNGIDVPFCFVVPNHSEFNLSPWYYPCPFGLVSSVNLLNLLQIKEEGAEEGQENVITQTGIQPGHRVNYSPLARSARKSLMTTSSQGCSLISHLPDSTSRSAAPCPAVLRNWFASDLKEGMPCTQSPTLFIPVPCFLFFLLGDSPVQLLSPAWLCLPWDLTVSQPEVMQTECYLQKPKCIRVAFFPPSSLPSQRAPTLPHCQMGLCWDKVASVILTQLADPTAKMNALVLSFQRCLWSLHMFLCPGISFGCSGCYKQWYQLAWATSCSCQRRIWGM